MPKRKAPIIDAEEQMRRFTEAAKAVGADLTGKEFESAFKKAVPPVSKKPKKR